MSSWTPLRLQRLPEAAVERARLTVVPRLRTRAPRMPFVILVALVLLGGVVGLLLFNTSMQQGSFRATALQKQADQLHAQQQSLRMELDRLRDPQRVAERAERLGMVSLVNPAFIKLADGSVVGDEVPASAEDRQRLTPIRTPLPAELRTKTVKVPADVTPDTGIDGVPTDEPGPGAGTTGTAH